MRFAGGGFRGAGFRGGFVGSSRFAFRPGFAGRRFIGPGRFAFRPGFRRFNRFAFAAVPFGVGLGYGYGGSCWDWQLTEFGWQRVWTCGYGAYGYGGYGYY